MIQFHFLHYNSLLYLWLIIPPNSSQTEMLAQGPYKHPGISGVVLLQMLCRLCEDVGCQSLVLIQLWLLWCLSAPLSSVYSLPLFEMTVVLSPFLLRHGRTKGLPSAWDPGMVWKTWICILLLSALPLPVRMIHVAESTQSSHVG